MAKGKVSTLNLHVAMITSKILSHAEENIPKPKRREFLSEVAKSIKAVADRHPEFYMKAGE